MSYQHKHQDNRLYASLSPQQVQEFFQMGGLFKHYKVGTVDFCNELSRAVSEGLHINNFTCETYQPNYETLVIRCTDADLRSFLNERGKAGDNLRWVAAPEDMVTFIHEPVVVPFTEEGVMQYLLIPVTKQLPIAEDYETNAGRLVIDLELDVQEQLLELTKGGGGGYKTYHVPLPIFEHVFKSMQEELTYINEDYAPAFKSNKIKMTVGEVLNDPWRVQVMFLALTQGHPGSYAVRGTQFVGRSDKVTADPEPSGGYAVRGG